MTYKKQFEAKNKFPYYFFVCLFLWITTKKSSTKADLSTAKLLALSVILSAKPHRRYVLRSNMTNHQAWTFDIAFKHQR